MRPDNSQNQGTGASRRGLSMTAVREHARDDPASVGRALRLGVALAAMAQELASARREILALKRENATLRSSLAPGNAR